MKVIILAGGKGTRLSPYTVVFPKPLLPIGDKPILEIIIRQLAFYGLKDIILSVGHLGELIQAYSQNCEKPHYWLDIGRYEDYQKATEEFEKRKEEFLPEGI